MPSRLSGSERANPCPAVGKIPADFLPACLDRARLLPGRKRRRRSHIIADRSVLSYGRRFQWTSRRTTLEHAMVRRGGDLGQG